MTDSAVGNDVRRMSWYNLLGNLSMDSALKVQYPAHGYSDTTITATPQKVI